MGYSGSVVDCPIPDLRHQPNCDLTCAGVLKLRPGMSRLSKLIMPATAEIVSRLANATDGVGGLDFGHFRTAASPHSLR